MSGCCKKRFTGSRFQTGNRAHAVVGNKNMSAGIHHHMPRTAPYIQDTIGSPVGIIHPCNGRAAHHGDIRFIVFIIHYNSAGDGCYRNGADHFSKGINILIHFQYTVITAMPVTYQQEFAVGRSGNHFGCFAGFNQGHPEGIFFSSSRVDHGYRFCFLFGRGSGRGIVFGIIIQPDGYNSFCIM